MSAVSENRTENQAENQAKKPAEHRAVPFVVGAYPMLPPDDEEAAARVVGAGDQRERPGLCVIEIGRASCRERV